MTYQLDAARRIRDQHLTGETVVLSESANDCHGLVGCTFSSGTLKLNQKSSRWPIVIVGTTVVDSDVIAVKRQKDDRFFTTRFINCRFHGIFSGIDFGRGHRPELHEDFGTVEDCDFTEAMLDGCRFVNTDVSTLKLPRYEHAVLIEPYKRAADVAPIAWPGHLGQYMKICTDKPESFKALVIHIPSLARLVKCTEDEVKAALEKFGGVVM
ncbi:MAG: hypothetical protein RLY71_2197 [Pseudomonadota bacterium]|jgi:hypothetical protein